MLVTIDTIYPTIRLSDGGLAKLKEARESGVDRMPNWLREEMNHAAPDSNETVVGVGAYGGTMRYH